MGKIVPLRHWTGEIRFAYVPVIISGLKRLRWHERLWGFIRYRAFRKLKLDVDGET